MLADPQDFPAAANLISEHKVELEYLAELIQWRLKLRRQKSRQSNADNPFYWRFTLQGAGVPPFVEEDVVGYYDRGEYDRAKVLFRLLTPSESPISLLLFQGINGSLVSPAREVYSQIRSIGITSQFSLSSYANHLILGSARLTSPISFHGVGAIFTLLSTLPFFDRK